MKNKISLISFYILLCSVLFTSCNLAPGSYPYAEIYEINASETKTIDAVTRYKKNNPRFILPDDIPLIDGRRNSQDHWYHFYFFDAEQKQVFKTWVRGVGENKTNFAFVAVYDSNFPNRWKLVNKEFDDVVNDKYKRKFETEIINGIKANLN